MASFSLLDATTWVHGFDFTGKTNQISVSVEVEDLDATVFGSGGYRSRKGGLKEVTGEHSGFWDSEVDEQVFDDLGVINRAVTVSPTGVEGATAYMYQGAKFSYEQFGAVGELTPFSLSMMSTDGVGVVRGQIAATKQAVDATGVLGIPVELGAVAADQFLYATVHVFSEGTTIELDIESDSASDFPSATTRASIGPLTLPGGTWMTRVAGPITDTFFRVNVTNVTGEFEIAVAVAIA